MKLKKLKRLCLKSLIILSSLIVFNGCASIEAPDVPVCKELDPQTGYCSWTISNKSVIVDEQNKFEEKTWWEHRPYNIILFPSSYAKFKATMTKICSQYQKDCEAQGVNQMLQRMDEVVDYQKQPKPEPKVEVKKLTLDEKFLTLAKELAPLDVDLKLYCGKEPKDRTLFFASVLKNMAIQESSLKNSSTYYECSKKSCPYSGGCFESAERGFCMKSGSTYDGGYVVSRGLFQLSISSSRSLGCDFIQKPEDLHDEDKNIKCAGIILKRYISQDKRLAGRTDKWLGASRYWAVMRETKGGQPRESYAEIKSKACKN